MHSCPVLRAASLLADCNGVQPPSLACWRVPESKNCFASREGTAHYSWFCVQGLQSGPSRSGMNQSRRGCRRPAEGTAKSEAKATVCFAVESRDPKTCTCGRTGTTGRPTSASTALRQRTAQAEHRSSPGAWRSVTEPAPKPRKSEANAKMPTSGSGIGVGHALRPLWKVSEMTLVFENRHFFCWTPKKLSNDLPRPETQSDPCVRIQLLGVQSGSPPSAARCV